MRHYEILLLIHPDQSNQIPAMLEKYQAIIGKNGGQVHRQEDWGKLQLAYQINKLHKAHYILLNIECDNAALVELNNAFKFNDAIIRNLVTKCDSVQKEQSIFLKNKEAEKTSKESGGYGSSGHFGHKEYGSKEYGSKEFGRSKDSNNQIVDATDSQVGA